MVIPPKPSLFHLKFLTGEKPLLTLDDEFLRNHTKVLLISDASDKIWEVKLDGNRLAGGWEEFAAVNNFSDGNVLVFRHNGEEIFHVAVSSDIQHASPSFTDTDDTEVDDEPDGEDEDTDDDACKLFDVFYFFVFVRSGWDVLVRKNKKPEADSCFLRARVTRYNLIKDRLDLSRDFKFMSFNKHNKPCEIYLANEKGRKWTLRLSRNISSGAFYITRGWSNFCSANGLIRGDFCYFKLSKSGERPVLLLCSHESGNGLEDKEEKRPEADPVKVCSVGGCTKEKNTPRILTLKYTPSRFKTGQLYISPGFLLESGIRKSREITLLNKDGRKWLSYLQMTGKSRSEWFYMRKGWREMCKANGVEVNDSFMLELICEDVTPIFKFHSKIENKGACESVEKTQGVEIDGQRGSKRGHTRVSNRSNTNSRKFQRTLPESSSVSDLVANVKQRIQDTLNTLRHFRAEIETKEKNLEASLLQVDALGLFLNRERILGISKILNSNLDQKTVCMHFLYHGFTRTASSSKLYAAAFGSSSLGSRISIDMEVEDD
ncbi:unnamed protein product [Brassica oleracea var. botrytis]